MTYRVDQKSDTPVLILRDNFHKYTTILTIFHCYNKKCMAHKSTRNILGCDQSNYSSRIILAHIPAKLLSWSWIR